MNDESRSPALSLHQIQQWMQAVITHPGGIETGIGSDRAREQLEITPDTLSQVVLPSRALSSGDRLTIYANAYYARLLECMRSLFPVLVYSIGQETFDQFAFGYLQVYPSKSYTLGRLAESFVTYLDETRPGENRSDRSRESAGDADWTDFLVDLARLEWTIDQVFDGPGIENEQPLTPADVQGMSPAEWSSARLVPAPCLHLLSFHFPVNEYFTCFRRGSQPRIPRPKQSFVAITRRAYRVQRMDLSREQFVMLTALVGGSTIGDAIAAVAEVSDDPERLAVPLRDWFKMWGAAGFFMNVESESGSENQ